MGDSPSAAPSLVTAASTDQPEAFANETARVDWSRDKLRKWGAMSFFSLLDQGLNSAAGFGANILLARWMTAYEYGAFTVAFAGYLFLAGFHNVLLLEPLSVIGPARHASELPCYFRVQLHVHSILVWPLSVAILAAAALGWRFGLGVPLAGALAGGGLALPVLLLLWLARRICYVLARPSLAVLGSGLYLAFVIAALALWHALRPLSPFDVFVISACGSLIGSLVILWPLGLGPTRHAPGSHSITVRATLAENWSYGRWLVGSTLLYSVSNQIQTFLVAAFLGLGVAGVLRAAQVPSLVMAQVVTATGLLILPTLASDFGRGLVQRMRHKANVISALLGAGALGFVAFLAIFPERIEHLLYGGKYRQTAWLIPLLGLVPAANAISTGYAMAMRAAQKPNFDLFANAIAAPVSFISVVLFIHWWRLAGAAASMVLSSTAAALMTVWMYRRTVQHQVR